MDVMAEDLIRTLAEFDPDADVLLHEMCARADDELLVSIASCDYGRDYEGHLAALRSIVATRIVPCPLPWEPHEVCALVLWEPPETFEPRRASDASPEDLANHTARAFACAILLRAAHDDTEGYEFGENQTAATGIASALALGAPLPLLTQGTLAALAASDTCDPEERPILALGVLLCELAEGARRDGSRLLRLAEAIIAEEDRVRRECHAATRNWLLGLTYYNIRDPMWRSLARHCLVLPPVPHPPKADETLRLIGGMLIN